MIAPLRSLLVVVGHPGLPSDGPATAPAEVAMTIQWADLRDLDQRLRLPLTRQQPSRRLGAAEPSQQVPAIGAQDAREVRFEIQREPDVDKCQDDGGAHELGRDLHRRRRLLVVVKRGVLALVVGRGWIHVH